MFKTMINLLPIEDKILIRKEYLRRLSVIIGIFLFGFICIAAILLYPSYFLLVSQKKILENRLAVLQQSFEIKNADKFFYFRRRPHKNKFHHQGCRRNA